MMLERRFRLERVLVIGLIGMVIGCGGGGSAGSSSESAPVTPLNLIAEATKSTGVQLTWEGSSQSESHFEIERHRGDGQWTLVGRAEKNQNLFHDSFLEPLTSYIYRVVAVNEFGRSTSKSVTSRTLSASWSRSLNGPGDESFQSILTLDDSVVCTGTTDSFGAGGKDVWVSRFDDSGELLWSYCFGGVGEEKAYGATLDGNDDIYVLASTDTYGSGGEDFWLLKLDQDGTVLFEKTYGGTADEIPSTIEFVGSSDRLVMAGKRVGLGTNGDSDGLVVMATTAGDETKSFTIPDSELITTVYEAGDGGVVLGGNGDGSLGDAGLVIFLGPEGEFENLAWIDVADGDEVNGISSLATDSDLAIVGTTNIGGNTRCTWVSRISGDAGLTRWTKLYAFNDSLMLVSTKSVHSVESELIIAGTMARSDVDGLIFRLTRSGEVSWAWQFDARRNHSLDSVEVSDQGRVSVSGMRVEEGLDPSGWAVFGEPDGSIQFDADSGLSIREAPIYPVDNPFVFNPQSLPLPDYDLTVLDSSSFVEQPEFDMQRLSRY